MAKLNKNWITEKLVDFEYKKYILLAYLKEVEDNFGQNRLYPVFSELIEHYKLAQAIRQSKSLLSGQFPHQLSKLDLESLTMEYERILEDDQLMQEITQIIDYSIPKFEHYLEEGRKIYEFIEQHLSISPVGLIPLRNDFGYLFLLNGEERETRAYKYELTIFEGPDEKYRGLHTKYITSFHRNLSTTFENMRSELIRSDTFSGVPATYLIESELRLPYTEALLPIARRMLIRHISAA